MSFEIIPACDVSFLEQARVANEAFAGYVGGWSDLNPETLTRFLCLQGADLFYSRLVRNSDGLAGFGYINRTGNILRLTGMGIIPEARGTGVAAHLLEHLCEEAKNRGDEAMMLEVIQQNPRAVSFYRRHGFHEISQLFSWRRSESARQPDQAATAMEEIPIRTALELPNASSYPNVPWQISRHAVAKVEKTRAFRAGSACLVISDPAATPIRVHGIFGDCEQPAELRAALAAVLRRFSGGEFFVPAIWPEKFGREVFEPLGFVREPLSQFLMRRDFL